jgi:hypothetical protein
MQLAHNYKNRNRSQFFMYRQVFMTKAAHKQERDGASRPIFHVTDGLYDYRNAIRRLAPLGSYRVSAKKSVNGTKNPSQPEIAIPGSSV